MSIGGGQRDFEQNVEHTSIRRLDKFLYCYMASELMIFLISVRRLSHLATNDGRYKMER